MFDLQPIKTDIHIKGFNSIYYFEFGKNFTHSPEKHDFWEMVFVDAGRIIAITDGVGCMLNQGQAIFHEPNEIHAHVSDTQTPNNMLVISFTTDSEIMKFFSKKTFTLDKTSKTLLSLFIEETKDALGKIPGDYNNRNPLDFSDARIGSTQLLSCYFSEFLIKLLRSGTNAGRKISHGEGMRRVTQDSITRLICDYLKENVYSAITLEDICTHFLMGKSQLCAIFRDNTGTSIMNCYTDLKIAEAKKLLRDNCYSVSQISDMLKYSCIHTFSRAFKQKVGFSPAEYRKSIDFGLHS